MRLPDNSAGEKTIRHPELCGLMQRPPASPGECGTCEKLNPMVARVFMFCRFLRRRSGKDFGKAALGNIGLFFSHIRTVICVFVIEIARPLAHCVHEISAAINAGIGIKPFEQKGCGDSGKKDLELIGWSKSPSQISGIADSGRISGPRSAFVSLAQGCSALMLQAQVCCPA